MLKKICVAMVIISWIIMSYEAARVVLHIFSMIEYAGTYQNYTLLAVAYFEPIKTPFAWIVGCGVVEAIANRIKNEFQD